MIEVIPVNVTSFKIVHSELISTLEKASRHFEAYVVDKNAVDQLRESTVSLTEIIGVFKMLNVESALELAELMQLLNEKLIEGNVNSTDFVLSALSHAYVGLPCYIEYIIDREQVIPALIAPFVNELRAALRMSLELEHASLNYTVNQEASLLDASLTPDPEFESLIKRLRQMYQIGLVGLIHEENIELKLQLIHRAMSRLAKSVGDNLSRTQWRLVEAVAEGMLSGDLELNFTRKRVLSLIDSVMREVIETQDYQNILLKPELLSELVFLVHISSCSHVASTEVF